MTGGGEEGGRGAPVPPGGGGLASPLRPGAAGPVAHTKEGPSGIEIIGTELEGGTFENLP